ncbi:hypothetical protein M0813_02976 [Anaeramoeba flamelloides]|uniref:Uncharacterized protein n=1 Tax=Anaeramoeba flamelloides TaxID=1746091 RepID=A0ABQ8YEX8_9EUKA|nr:hypothetical protein M0813_02976 [Anaeramoeba flamelloides]
MTDSNNFVSLKELQIEFQKIRRFKDRLQKLMELRPGSIHGVTTMQLQSSSLNDKKNSQWKKLKAPKEILVKRSDIMYLSELTQLKKKSVERGLSIFFEKTFKLYNTREYSREWMIFRQDRPQKRKKPQGASIIRYKPFPLSKSSRPQQKKRATLKCVNRVQSQPLTLPKSRSKKTKSKSKLNLKFKKKRNSFCFDPKKSNPNSPMGTNSNCQSFSNQKNTRSNYIINTLVNSNNKQSDKQLDSQILHFNTHTNSSIRSSNHQNVNFIKKEKEKDTEHNNEKNLAIEIENEEAEKQKWERFDNQQTRKRSLYSKSHEIPSNQEMNEFQKRFYEITFQPNEPENNQLLIDNDIHWSTLGDMWSCYPNRIFL